MQREVIYLECFQIPEIYLDRLIVPQQRFPHVSAGQGKKGLILTTDIQFTHYTAASSGDS